MPLLDAAPGTLDATETGADDVLVQVVLEAPELPDLPVYELELDMVACVLPGEEWAEVT
jgi:hypothetical protein